MNLNQINRLVATAPPTIDARQRSRLQAHQETASRCELRIRKLREELERSLQTPTDAGGLASHDGSAELNATLTIACELDVLERLQPRVDTWLKDYVTSLAAVHEPVDYGDGQPV
jgi:hypothetical protein